MARAALEELLNTRRDIPRLDAELRSPLLADDPRLGRVVPVRLPRPAAAAGRPVPGPEITEDAVTIRHIARGTAAG